MGSVNYVLVNTKLGAEINVAEKMRKIPHVVKAQAVFGVYDIVAEVESTNMDEHKKVVEEDIRGIENLRNTLSFIAVADKNGPLGFKKDENGNITYCHPSLR